MIKIETSSRWGGVRPGAGGKPRTKPPAATIHTDPRWYVVRTRYAQDTDAATTIVDLGFPVFAPTIQIPATRRRRNAVGALIPARPAHTRSLFGGYIFARFALTDHWQPIRDLPTVETILGLAPDAPTPMPDRDMDLLRGMCDADGCYHPNGNAPNSLVGKMLRLLEGPMTDHVGLCDWSDDHRVRFSPVFFGRPCPITVEQSAVEAA